VTLTPSERRGALALLAIFSLGAVRDLWEARVAQRASATGSAPATLGSPARLASPVADLPPAGAVAGDSPAMASPAMDPGPLAPARARPLDLNRASVAELDELPGVGPVLAGRIVEYRRLHGPFRAVEELLAVRGVGPKSFGRLRDRVSVGEPGGAPPAP